MSGKPQGGGGRSEGPDPSKYLRSRSAYAFPSQPSTSEDSDGVIKQPNVALRSRHLETRSGDAGDDPSEWDVVDQLEFPKDSITEEVYSS